MDLDRSGPTVSLADLQRSNTGINAGPLPSPIRTDGVMAVDMAPIQAVRPRHVVSERDQNRVDFSKIEAVASSNGSVMVGGFESDALPPRLASSAKLDVSVSSLTAGSPWRFPPRFGVVTTPETMRPKNTHHVQETTFGQSTADDPPRPRKLETKVIQRYTSHRALAVLLMLMTLPSPVRAQETALDTVRQVSTHMGEMIVDLTNSPVDIDDALRFEPYQQLGDMFSRDDVVYVMRHGPTDWSKLDEPNVAPTDCANQRIMSPKGRDQMRDLGTLLASNDVLPSRIVVSQWCRNQQTVEMLKEGFDRVDPAIAKAMPVRTDPALNLLLSLQGAPDVTGLRQLVEAWEGDPDRKGPLLLITHYTDIEEMTQFRVFEGEILVLDPKRDNLVLGYLRLRSAAPDVGHFADALASPLTRDDVAQDMVLRYYDALNATDATRLASVLQKDWVLNGTSPTRPPRDMNGFLAELDEFSEGMSDASFKIQDLYVADGIVTVIGTITGRHTGLLLGIPATGREVSFGSIGVHRIENGAIVETWQMLDQTTLLEEISR